MRDFDSIAALFERPVPCVEAQAVIDSLSFHDKYPCRTKAIRRYGFSVPCVEAVRLLAGLSPLLEVGAGSGYWTRLLKAAGADVVATDVGGQVEYSCLWLGMALEVKEMGAAEAVGAHPDRNVFVSWPSYDKTWAAEMAARMCPGRSLSYIGEGHRGCTADDGFHCLLKEGFSEVGSLRIPQWDGIHDRLVIYVRK